MVKPLSINAQAAYLGDNPTVSYQQAPTGNKGSMLDRFKLRRTGPQE